MNILYGIVGEGLGHATRSGVLIEYLLQQGHHVRIVASGKALPYTTKRLASHPNVQIEEIFGLHFAFDDNKVNMPKTLWSNISQAPQGLTKNIHLYYKMRNEGYRPDLVISDFESWTQLYALNHRLPLISFDNQQALTRCKHEVDIFEQKGLSYHLTQMAVKGKMPNAYHYLVTSFFFPPVKQPKTTLLPPILRPHVLDAKREPQDHILVYQSAAKNPSFLEALQKLPYTFKIYGAGEEGVHGNIQFCGFSETGFIDDLRTAKAVVANSGFSLLGEAVHLRVPILAVPIKCQYEQVLNAHYIKELGYGDWSYDLTPEHIEAFLSKTPRYDWALSRYRPQGNNMLYSCVDELLHNISLNEPAPSRLHSPAMGKYYAPPLPEENISLIYA